ncbi:MAG: hypothetical protein CVU18_12780 [Betaproteobacteria bacterium HGW-Betaproteobacteria-12]|nr:MAG: hypothetical protein CVU18_12780 [Betaproteobacteria bacterium HGW-Betaproteobacteria-12]
MKCPHCQVEFHGNPNTAPIGRDVDGHWASVRHLCPACNHLTIELVCADTINVTGQGRNFTGLKKELIGYPAASTRPGPPQEVPAEFADDYREAAAVLPVSPKASAALSRRCLQHVLREKAGVKRADLAKEIDEVLGANTLPSHLAQAIDAIRNIGNFAAHPVKSSASGTVVPVELGEAEWTLDVLDGLFDFYFVQPTLLQQRRAALNAKLAAAGKPPVK